MATAREKADKLVERLFHLGEQREEQQTAKKIFQRSLGGRMRDVRRKRSDLKEYRP